MAMDRPERSERPGRPNRKGRKKVCAFCVDKIEEIDYKDINRLRKYITERAKIMPRRMNGQTYCAAALCKRLMTFRTASRKRGCFLCR